MQVVEVSTVRSDSRSRPPRVDSHDLADRESRMLSSASHVGAVVRGGCRRSANEAEKPEVAYHVPSFSARSSTPGRRQCALPAQPTAPIPRSKNYGCRPSPGRLTLSWPPPQGRPPFRSKLEGFGVTVFGRGGGGGGAGDDPRRLMELILSPGSATGPRSQGQRPLGRSTGA